MKKLNTTTAFSTNNLSTNYSTKKESLLDQFIEWFRNFLDNAE